MYRAGIRELESGYSRLSRQVYFRVAEVVKRIANSYIGYFGDAEFVELMGNPLTFTALCVAAGLDEFSPSSVVAVLAGLKDGVPLSYGVAVTGGYARNRFRVPEEIERLGLEMGLSSAEIRRLQYCSRMVAKVDDAAVQDGYRLWFHSMVFSRGAVWAVIQMGSRSSLNRIYHWFSGRVSIKGFVDEPHTGLISDAKSRYVLDFTMSENRELRSASLEVLEAPLSRLRAIHSATLGASQTTLGGFLGEGDLEVNPMTAPVKVNWSLLSKLSERQLRSFEELLAIRGVGSETLRFLAICVRSLFGVEPCLSDRAALIGQESPLEMEEEGEELFWNLIEAVRSSSLNQEAANSIIMRLKAWWAQHVRSSRPN